MANYFEELIERAEKEAEERVTKKQKERFARDLLELGENTLEGIAKVTGLTLEHIQKLAAKMQRA